MVTQQESRLMKEGAARAYLGGMSHGQLFRLRQERRIRSVNVGRSVYFDRVDLDEFIESLAIDNRESTADGPVETPDAGA